MKKSLAGKHRPSSSKTYGNSLARTGAPRSRLLEADWERAHHVPYFFDFLRLSAEKVFSSDFFRLSAEKVFFKRFLQAFSRKSFFRAISSGFWLKKFFSSDFLRLSAEKVFFERFPQAIAKSPAGGGGNQFPSIGRTLLFVDIRNAPRQPELPANKKTEIPYVELTLNRSLDDDRFLRGHYSSS